ncbi:MAG: hypothetical protein EPN25_05540 [Nitrospirae bacterium]|nr:MAG: hypothetical protein EPN25_05540 [Nitrospirota bacterium]
MKKMLIILAVLLLVSSPGSPAFAVCPCTLTSSCVPNTDTWVVQWTDDFTQTTYQLEAPCKVLLGTPFDVIATVTDAAYPNDLVGHSWAVKDEGSVIAGGGFNWIETVGGIWQTTISQTYSGVPINHLIEFAFSDLGQGGGGHNWATSLVGETTVDPFPPAAVGIYAEGVWYLDLNGSRAWDGTPADSLFSYGGLPGAVPVTGDWDGSGTTKLGIYADGLWYLDLDGSGGWDGTPADSMFFYGGMPGGLPVTGDWDGNGTTKIGIYSDGVWYLDMDGNGAWDGTPTDSLLFFGGMAGGVPVTGDWNGSGTAKIGIYADGVWYLDLDGNGAWDGTPTDSIFAYGGMPGAMPVTGKW